MKLAQLTAVFERLDRIEAEQAAQRALLERILSAVDRHRGPRDQFEANVLRAIGETIRDEDDFNASELLQHSLMPQNVVLKRALIAADVINPRDFKAAPTCRSLGRLLVRLEAGAGGLRLECVNEAHRAGRRYQLRLSD